MAETLCGTCRFWDHATLERKGLTEMSNRIAACLWGKDMIFPEWCEGLRGHYWTNEAGTTERGCKTYERMPGLQGPVSG